MLKELSQMTTSQADFFLSELEKAKNEPRPVQASKEEKASKAYQEFALSYVKENYGDLIDSAEKRLSEMAAGESAPRKDSYD